MLTGSPSTSATLILDVELRQSNTCSDANNKQQLKQVPSLFTSKALADNKSQSASVSTDHEPQPTEEDLRRLRRISGPIPWSIYTIVFLELFECASRSGTFIVLINFLQQPLPPGSTTGAGHAGQSGALNMGQRFSTAISLSKSILFHATPLIGALVADQYLGRYKTLQWACLFAFFGHIIIVLAGIPSIVMHPKTTLIPLLVGIILMAFGNGGLKPNIATLVVEQVSDKGLNVAYDRKGRRVIIDPEATRSRVLLYFYCLANIGDIVGMVSMVYAEKFVGFWLSFAIPTVLFCLCPLILFLCRRRYTSAAPSSSVLANAIRLCALSLKGQWSWNPVKIYQRTHHPDFWTRVRPSKIENRPDWMSFEDPWVDEVRQGLRACKVFCWFPLYMPALRQMHSNMASQAATLDLSGLPNDVLINFNPLFCMTLSPIYAHIIYPAIDRLGLRFTLRHRICVGFLFSAVAMAFTAVLQHYIYVTSPCGSHANHCNANANTNTKLTVWLQIPAYFLISHSEILAYISGLQFAYSQAPSNMRSLIMALFILSGAFGSAVTEALVPLCEDPWLVWNYTAVGIMSLVASVGVWWCD